MARYHNEMGSKTGPNRMLVSQSGDKRNGNPKWAETKNKLDASPNAMIAHGRDPQTRN
jgi:hypothetical protein